MSRLSGREQAVWDKRNAGLTFKQIAEELGICPVTVSFAYGKAYRKIEYEKAMKISKLTEYENIGSVEDFKQVMDAYRNELNEVKQLKSEQNKVAVEKLEELRARFDYAPIIFFHDTELNKRERELVEDEYEHSKFMFRDNIDQLLEELKGESKC